jgi:hypothetical protein
MTQEEIKFNQLCHDFLFPNAKEEYESGEISIEDGLFSKAMGIFGHFNLMKYHSDWNWIMKVVEKIEELGFATKIQHDYCISNYGCDSCEIDTRENALFIPDEYKEEIEPIVFELTKTKKQASVQAIYKFLIWYNENNK